MDPLEGGELNVFETTPALRTLSRSTCQGSLRPSRRFGLDVTGRRRYNVERDTPSASQASDGRLNTRLGEPLGVTGRDVLHAAIAVMHQWIFWV